MGIKLYPNEKYPTSPYLVCPNFITLLANSLIYRANNSTKKKN